LLDDFFDFLEINYVRFAFREIAFQNFAQGGKFVQSVIMCPIFREVIKKQLNGLTAISPGIIAAAEKSLKQKQALLVLFLFKLFFKRQKLFVEKKLKFLLAFFDLSYFR
jgi:hypothetical protein